MNFEYIMKVERNEWFFKHSFCSSSRLNTKNGSWGRLRSLVCAPPFEHRRFRVQTSARDKCFLGYCPPGKGSRAP